MRHLTDRRETSQLKFHAARNGRKRKSLLRLPCRQWPHRLEISVEEHVPLARWNDAALVNAQGEVFNAAYKAPLPRFTGREEVYVLSAGLAPFVCRVVPTNPGGRPPLPGAASLALWDATPSSSNFGVRKPRPATVMDESWPSSGKRG